MKINRRLLNNLDALSRRDLKALMIALRGRACYGRKAVIVNMVAAAIREYLGIDD